MRRRAGRRNLRDLRLPQQRFPPHRMYVPPAHRLAADPTTDNQDGFILPTNKWDTAKLDHLILPQLSHQQRQMLDETGFLRYTTPPPNPLLSIAAEQFYIVTTPSTPLASATAPKLPFAHSFCHRAASGVFFLARMKGRASRLMSIAAVWRCCGVSDRRSIRR